MLGETDGLLLEDGLIDGLLLEDGLIEGETEADGIIAVSINATITPSAELTFASVYPEVYAPEIVTTLEVEYTP